MRLDCTKNTANQQLHCNDKRNASDLIYMLYYNVAIWTAWDIIKNKYMQLPRWRHLAISKRFWQIYTKQNKRQCSPPMFTTDTNLPSILDTALRPTTLNHHESIHALLLEVPACIGLLDSALGSFLLLLRVASGFSARSAWDIRLYVFSDLYLSCSSWSGYVCSTNSVPSPNLFSSLELQAHPRGELWVKHGAK